MSKRGGTGEVRIRPLAVDGEIRPKDSLSGKLLAAVRDCGFRMETSWW
jgi:hypothetical protein